LTVTSFGDPQLAGATPHRGWVALSWSLRRLGDGVRHPASCNRTEGKNVVMTVLIETSSDRWTRMIRRTGLVGLVTIVVLFAAVIASAPGEPPFVASPEEALAFYLNSTAGWVQAAMAVAGLAVIGWI
jgi:hypothetical protein